MKLKPMKLLYDLTFRVISVSYIGMIGIQDGFIVVGEITDDEGELRRQSFIVPVDYDLDPADPKLEAHSPVQRRWIVVEPGAVLDAMVSGRQITMPDGQTAILIERIRIGYDVTFRVVSVSDIRRLIPGPYGLKYGFVVTGETIGNNELAGRQRQTFVARSDYLCSPSGSELAAYSSAWGIWSVVESGTVLDAVSGKRITMPDGQTAILLDGIRINERYACSCSITKEQTIVV